MYFAVQFTPTQKICTCTVVLMFTLLNTPRNQARDYYAKKRLSLGPVNMDNGVAENIPGELVRIHLIARNDRQGH